MSNYQPTQPDQDTTLLAAHSESARLPPSVPGEFLVKYKSQTAHVSRMRAKYGASIQSHRSYRAVPGLQRVKLAPGISESQLLATLRQDAEIEFVEPNYIFRIHAVPNDPSFAAQWPLQNTGQNNGVADADIDAAEAWDVTTGDPDIVIAVLDTGVDYNHVDLAANIYSNPADCDADGSDDDANGFVDDCHGIDTVNDDSDPMDDNGHGTHVAGIIGAVGNNGIGISGVAWNAKLLPCKFMGAGGEGNSADAIACLDYVASLHDRGVNIVASNNSWGEGVSSRALYEAIQRQQQRGILFVAAAGNAFGTQPRSIDESYMFEAGSIFPCAYALPNVMCVGNSTNADQHAFTSFLGDHTVHVFAPGQDILSTMPGNQYGVQTGTSMATPHVAGVIALVKAAFPTLDWLATRNRVLAGGDYAPHRLGFPDYRWTAVTRRRVNALGALSCSAGTVTRRVQPRTPEVINYYWRGVPLTLAVLNIDCENPRGPVSVTVNPGNVTIALVDDGNGVDVLAGDGVYSSTWTPAASGTYTLSFPGQIYRDSPGVVTTDNLTVIVDEHLKPGFPVKTLHSAGTFSTNILTLVANVDATPDQEIITTGYAVGPTYAWKSNGEAVSGWPLWRNGRPYAMSVLSAANLVGGADELELIGGFADDGRSSPSDPGLYEPIEAYNGAGQLLAGWPRFAGPYLTSPPTLVDLNGDGISEVIQGGGEYTLVGFGSDGSVVPGFPASPDRPGQVGAQHVMSPLAADLDADGHIELVLTRGGDYYNPTSLVVLRDNGTFATGFPRALSQDCTLVGLGDIDADGMIEIVCIGAVADPSGSVVQIYIYESTGELERTIEVARGPYDAQGAALADLTQDGIPEIVVPYRYYDSYWQRSDYYVAAFSGTGSLLPGWPVSVDAIPQSTASTAPVVGDVDGDGLPEIVLTAEGTLHVLNADGSTVPGTPKPLPQGFVYYNIGTVTPVIADLDADGRNDIVLTSTLWDGRNGWLPQVIAYDLGGPTTGGAIEWGQYRGAADRRGYYETGKNLSTQAYVAVRVQGLGRVTSNIAGIDCGSDCLGLFAKGGTVQLTATPSANAQFVRWIGACEGQGSTCSLPVSQYQVTRAVFGGPTLSTTVTGPGTVISSPAGINCPGDCSEPFDLGTNVSLLAQPQANAYLVSWSGQCIDPTTPCHVTMNGAATITATFATKPRVRVEVTSGAETGTVISTASGINCGTICDYYFNPGTQVILQAMPVGNRSVRWSGACSGNAPSCVVMASASVLVRAEFTAPASVSLQIGKAGSGTGTVTSTPAGIACGATCVGSFATGTTVQLTASPSVGSAFTGWSGACAGMTPTCSVSLTAASTVTANFVLVTHPLVISKTGDGVGSVSSNVPGINCGTDCSEVYASNTVIALTATAEGNSAFAGWSGACSGATCSVTMNDTRTVSARFILKPVLTVTLGGNQGGVVTAAGINCGSDCTEPYDLNTSVTLTATANAGSTFIGWSGCASQGSTCTVSLNTARTVTASFALAPASSGGGTDTSGGGGSSGGGTGGSSGGGGSLDWLFLALLTTLLGRARRSSAQTPS